MKKELKALIKQLKLSDDQIMKLINASVESESDVMNEAEDPSALDEEKDKVEKNSTTESSNKKMSMKDLEKLIANTVKTALSASKEEALLPSQKPIKKSIPPAKQEEDISIGDFILV